MLKNDWAHDELNIRTTISLSLIDRLKVLFGYKLMLATKTETAEVISKFDTTHSQVFVLNPRPPRRQHEGMASIPESPKPGSQDWQCGRCEQMKKKAAGEDIGEEIPEHFRTCPLRGISDASTAAFIHCPVYGANGCRYEGQRKCVGSVCFAVNERNESIPEGGCSCLQKMDVTKHWADEIDADEIALFHPFKGWKAKKNCPKCHGMGAIPGYLCACVQPNTPEIHINSPGRCGMRAPFHGMNARLTCATCGGYGILGPSEKDHEQT